jgi:hypothetical protein
MVAFNHDVLPNANVLRGARARISEAVTGRCPATNLVRRVELKKRSSEDKRRYLESMSMEPKQARIAAVLMKTFLDLVSAVHSRLFGYRQCR